MYAANDVCIWSLLLLVFLTYVVVFQESCPFSHTSPTRCPKLDNTCCTCYIGGKPYACCCQTQHTYLCVYTCMSMQFCDKYLFGRQKYSRLQKIMISYSLHNQLRITACIILLGSMLDMCVWLLILTKESQELT